MVNRICLELQEWMQANPPEKGLNWSSNLEIALRAVSWILVYSLMRPTSDMMWNHFLSVLFHHGRHLEKNLGYTKTFAPESHLIGVLSALVMLGIFFDRTRWVNYYHQLDEEAGRQFYADGVHVEQSVNSQRFTLEFLLLTQKFLRSQGMTLSQTTQCRLDNAAQLIQWLERPDETLPNIGDNDHTLVIHPVLKACLYLYAEARLGISDKKTFRAFADGGFYIWRSGWTKDASYLVIKDGKHTRPGHADLLHFEYSRCGENILVDSGTYQYYQAPIERSYFLSPGAHNTAIWNKTFNSIRRLKTLKQKIFHVKAGPELSTIFDATIVYSAGRCIHRRILQTSEQLSEIIIDDTLRHASTAIAYFHIYPVNVVSLDGAIQPVTITTPSGKRLQMSFQSPGLQEINLETAAYSEKYGEIASHLRISVRFKRKNGEAYLKTMISEL
jgi:hypothetical protein